MTMNNLNRALLIFVLATLAVATSAQEKSEPPKDAGSSAGEGIDSHEASRLPEAELVYSPSFRSASLVQPVWKDLSADGHYFGGEGNNIGFAGGGWEFHGEGWKITPGFGVAFGDNGFRTMPALSFTWAYEHRWIVSEGLLVQGLLHTTFAPEENDSEPESPTAKSVVPSIADGNHLSVRWKRLTAGGTWEHMQFREGREWKGGLRLAFRILPPLSLTFFAMGPGSEIRGGILFQPVEKK